MLFSSPTFLYFFLPLALLLHWLSGKRLRNLILLTLSLIFYAWGEPKYVLILLLSILLNWGVGKLFTADIPKKNYILIAGCSANILLLVFFKYFGFLLGIAGLNKTIEGYLSIEINSIHLPIGISFFTFQAISYLIDVYKGKVLPQKSLIDFGLYLSLFPQLIAGPIVRYTDVVADIKKRIFSLSNLTDGFSRFIIGLSKKVLLANPAGELADQIFTSNYLDLSSQAAWIGVIAYTIQIFYDFSGYSDMAIGIGKMLGFKFPENFNYPYISKSIQEFWRRWHITLSTFFRDYVYIPLGGSRVSKIRIYSNILIVFLLTGLWHGASWNFIVWGVYHGFFLCLERLFLSSVLKKSIALISHIYTLLIVCIGWVIFRIEDISAMTVYLTRLLSTHPTGLSAQDLAASNYAESMIAISLGAILSIPVIAFIKNKILSPRVGSKRLISLSRNIFLETATVSTLLLLCIVKISTTAYNPFIYFRF